MQRAPGKSSPARARKREHLPCRFTLAGSLAIDKRNPQLAARILTSMRSWRSLEASRAEHAKAALSTIADAKGLSTDVSDIVGRILKG